ncbi:hypothetical protein BGX21_011444 [Mortierella sp. AD011]|nr:hypothetical protein BGX20_002183 [Mortierella sp. AD010]KAF9390533.1 hypothetical protein BGX21_011444 [Mortierella sp. AD011]
MSAHWKREKVQDHKFDFINVDDFVDNSCWRQFRYLLVFVAIIRGILVYCSDIFTAVNLYANSNSNSFFPKNGELSVTGLNFSLPYAVYKYLFSACIVVSFLLLALEIRRARAIIKSRDIAYAFTSQIASRYYTVRSYPHYCFFSQINNSKKMVDEVAFFCFFTFRNWKRLILADAPRQVINGTIIYQTFAGEPHISFFDWDTRFKNDTYKKISLAAMIFTVTVFAISLLSFIAAAFLYIPLVSHIRGNLKEFCCHKIDKRIDELILKNTKDRAKNNINDVVMSQFKEPTLPQLDLLETSPMPAKTPRSAYATPAYSPRVGGNAGYGQQKAYGYDRQMYMDPSPQQPGYAPNYSQDDYFQAKPPTKSQLREKKAFDPYAESAFTTDENHESYAGNQNKQPSSHDFYDVYGDYYKNAPSSQTRLYDDYSGQRSASPLPSQHGSDLESNHNSSNGSYGYTGGNNNYGGNNRYVNNSSYYTSDNNNRGNGNDYYPSSTPISTFSPQVPSQQIPQRTRRQDTASSRDRSARNNGGY